MPARVPEGNAARLKLVGEVVERERRGSVRIVRTKKVFSTYRVIGRDVSHDEKRVQPGFRFAVSRILLDTHGGSTDEPLRSQLGVA